MKKEKRKNNKEGYADIFRICFFLFSLLPFLLSCNNYFHELIPPDENRIVKFSVEGMIERAVISDNAVNAMVDNESPLSSMIPVIEISPKATLLPLTYAYLKAAFPSADILLESAAVFKAQDLSEYVMDLIKRNPDFTVPVLDKPIDFTGPVNFLVVSGMGNIRQYTVYVVKDTGEPRILGFGFSKYDNPELIRSASSIVNENAKEIQTSILYPAEMDTLSYMLIPSFEIFGERLEVDGVEIRSGIDAIQFTHALGIQTKTLTVWRKGMSADYILRVEFSEDPDSIRSIIDFRFNKAGNPGITANAVGSIVNNNALGSINVQVFYSGVKPAVLTPAFLSPGTVSVAGVTQTSGSSSHDFSQTLEYRVVSRNNLYTRTYTVVVDYIDIISAAPVFTSFKFSSGINPELVQDTESQISDSASLIMITARYGGSFAPETLIPEFRATGLVTVFGSVQTSGMSAQNFSTQVKYTVTDPENSIFKRDYWVQVTFIRDTSSGAAINSFSFHPDENPGLADELEGRIDHTAGTITIFAPVGSGVISRTMIPRFRAVGQVLVAGDVQISGTSGRQFNAPVVYEVVSANGINRKTYTVTVRELQSTIFVNQNAFGMGDGTSWQDAFRELSAACEAAALFPEDVPKEIWIAAGTYKPSTSGNREEYLLLAANTSYIGGFAGYETAKSQRSVAANKVVISGDLGGVYSYNLFGKFNGTTTMAVNGDVSFEALEFNSARANGSGNKAYGAAINAVLSNSRELRITDCDFNNLHVNVGGAVHINGGKLVITNTTIGNSSAALNLLNLSGAEINDMELHNITGDNLSFFNCSGDIEINNVDMRDISRGIYITGGSGRRELSHITGNSLTGSYWVQVSEGSSVTLTNSSFDTGWGIILNGSTTNRISQTTIKNISGNGIYIGGGTNTVIENVVVENVTNGVGMTLVNNGSIRISGSTLKDVQGSIGISLSGTGNAVVSNTTIENIQASSTAFFANMNGDLSIIDSIINNVVSTTSGLSFSGSGNTVISNTYIDNINTSANGYAIYASGRSLAITDSTIDNITAQYGVYGTNLTSVGINKLALQDIYNGLFLTNCSGDVEINHVDLQNVFNQGITITGDNASININDTNIKNVSGFNAIYISGRDVVIEEVNIENVPNGRGIQMHVSGTGQVIDSRIKNCKFVTSHGSGIFLSGSGNIVISDTTIEDVQAISGGGIFASAETSNLTISNSMIKNAITSNSGGGIYFEGNTPFVITGSRFENCRANSYGGAIYTNTLYSELIGEITNTTFLNCTARSGYKLVSRVKTFKGCTFEDNGDLFIYDPTSAINTMFGRYGAYFEDCTFTNLTDTYTGTYGYSGEKYIFGRYGSVINNDAIYTVNNDITLKNCIFNFSSGSAGLFALHAGTNNGANPDRFLMDGVKIYNNGCQQPLIWLHGNNTPGTFQFKNNNVYNNGTTDTPLNNAAAILGLAGSGILRLTNGATPVIVQ